MSNLINEGKRLKKASKILAKLTSYEKNFALECISNALIENADLILKANELDVLSEREKGTKESLIDRLTLTKEGIFQIAESVKTVINLKDPVGVTLSGHTKENGMNITKVTVPLGVISIIYESRPNVTIDATVLALKSGNCVLLRGSSSAINSNKAIVSVIKQGLLKSKVPADACILVEDTNRDLVLSILTMNEYLDLVIPRGGADLINFVTKNATVPTIETGVGNCHLYVDKFADLDMALKILENGKMQRPSVCNSLETLLVHQDIAEKFLKLAYEKINAEFRGCSKTCAIIDSKLATKEDYETEFLDYILAVKIVADIDEAISHIDEYSSRHSECIVTENYTNMQKFQKDIDASCVYVNASTRFTDGGEFGFGCEMGISTQKMHVRGPVALNHLVSTKYLITGNGQVR